MLGAPGLRSFSHARYAEDMKSDIGRWELDQRQHDANWGPKYLEAPSPPPFAFPDQAAPPTQQQQKHQQQLTAALGQMQLAHVHVQAQAQARPAAKPRTSPVATRTRVARHGSQPNPQRPSSSGADSVMLPYRGHHAPPRRAESYSHPTPLDDFRSSRRWPPNSYRQDDSLTPQAAEDLICAGASTFKGYWDEIPNAPEGYDRFYAVMDNEHQSRTDRAPFQQNAFRDMSMNMVGVEDSQFPWLSLDQPCMAYAFGKSAGTTTLNYWVSKSGSGNPPIKYAGEVRPRRLKLLQILDRLRQLEDGLEEDVSLSPPPSSFCFRCMLWFFPLVHVP